MKRRWRILGFVLVATACAAFALVYAIRAARSGSNPGTSGLSADPVALETVLRQPHLLFRSTKLDAGYGHLVAVSLADPSGIRHQTPLKCDRLDFAGGTGVCLVADRGVLTTYSAVIFDSRFTPLRTVRLGGIPSRVRVSPDGRFAGITVFVSGHSYAQGAFSTQTTLVETTTGAVVADLEQDFEIIHDGQPFKQPDFNFWGVTFARESTTFYATLGSGGTMYLIRGDANSRQATVIGQGVECPSLSPDERRIAFKQRQTVGGRIVWRLAVLDLSTNEQKVIAGETRSVDDQVEWLDDNRLLYAMPDPRQPGSMIVSVVSVDGASSQMFAEGAYSPSVEPAAQK